MADTTRSNLAPIGSRVGCVAPVATLVGAHPDRNREGNAAPQRRVVTGGTAVLRPDVAGHVLRVIELHVEAFFELMRKGLARGIGAIHVLMTDEADRAIGGVIFGSMTFNAVFVTRKTRSAGVVGPSMTVRAANRGVLLTGMKKLRIVLRERERKRH